MVHSGNLYRLFKIQEMIIRGYRVQRLNGFVLEKRMISRSCLNEKSYQRSGSIQIYCRPPGLSSYRQAQASEIKTLHVCTLEKMYLIEGEYLPSDFLNRSLTIQSPITSCHRSRLLLYVECTNQFVQIAKINLWTLSRSNDHSQNSIHN